MTIMRHLFFVAIMAFLLGGCVKPQPIAEPTAEAADFVRVQGADFIAPDGSKFFIRGTNLGNWLNPEGYMFGFRRANSPRLINEVICELAGEEFAAGFWRRFKDSYITRGDIEFIAATGANTVRLPFHYKLFTDEPYMGSSDPAEGFARIDSVVAWCRDNGLYLILDMHDCPGGQTGDNIDDSYGYPWIFTSGTNQDKFCSIWKNIARHYASEPVVLAYELMNEPIAHYFEDRETLNTSLAPLMSRAVDSIRSVDPNHIIMIGAAQWNSNFRPLSGTDFGPGIAYTCHRYGGPATAEAIDHYITFRDSTGAPMYMGEIGHNTDQWQADFVQVLEDNNIGYTFWPYKKIDSSCMNAYTAPQGWDSIVAFAEAPRGTFEEVRNARPGQVAAMDALTALIEAVKVSNCQPQRSYIEYMNLTCPQE